MLRVLDLNRWNDLPKVAQVSLAAAQFSRANNYDNVRSASVCTRHRDQLRIVNNGNEPWKRLFSIMGPALDDDDDDDDDDDHRCNKRLQGFQ